MHLRLAEPTCTLHDSMSTRLAAEVIMTEKCQNGKYPRISGFSNAGSAS